MKYYFFLICLLGFNNNCFADDHTEQDPNGEVAENIPSTPIKPKRGYPAIAPYVKTELSVVSIHSPTLENTPTPLLKMPKMGEFDYDLPHTNAGDEIYDITKWFPLDEMRGANEKEADSIERSHALM